MKRLLALLLAAVFILGGLASCSDTTVDSDVPVTDAPATDAPATDAPATDAPATDAPATEPPITATEPPVTEDTAELNGDPDGEYVYDRVVIICVSGAGTFLKKADTPNIDSIFDGGVVTYKMKAEVPTYTPQNIGSMLHGVTEDLHRITDRVIDSYTYFPESDYPSVFRVAREAYPDMNLSVFSTYAEIGKGIIENDLGVHIDTAETDAELTNKIIRHIQVRDPQLLFVQYNEVDAEGPVSGYGGKEYLDKIAETDGYIGRIYEALREEGMLEDTLFIVTTDHGGHGKYCGHDTNMEIGATFAVVGETVDPECKIKSMEIRDVVSVIAYALGLDQPDGWTAKLPDGLFAGAEAMERPTGEIEKEPVEPADLNTADLYADDGSDIYDRVVIIGVDGAGAFFKDADTPNLDAIFADGAVTYTMKTATPSISAQSWGSLLHGVTADLHGLTNSIIPYTPYNDDSIYPSLFKPVREAYPDADLVTFCWNSLNSGELESNLGIHKNSSGESEMAQNVAKYLEDHDPKVMFLYFGSPDGMGHGTGYGSEWHLNQISVVDGYIGQVYNVLDSMDMLKNTLLIVTTDHGGTPYGWAEHGGQRDVEMNIMYAVAGKTVVKGGTITSLDEDGKPADPQILDTPAIVAYALGAKPADTWTATVPGDLFEGVEATIRPMPTIVYTVEHRDQPSSPTPTKDSGKYITDILGANRVISYVTFDSDAADSMGKAAAVGDTLSYEIGYYGEAANMETGYAQVDFTPGSDSFSVAFWLKSPWVYKANSCLVANKDRGGWSNHGFSLSLSYVFDNSTDYHNGCINLNWGDGSEAMEATWMMPEDYKNGWVHVILSVDRNAGTVSLAYDFGEYVTASIPDSMKNSSFDGISGLVIGQDGTKNYAEALNAVIDDVLIIDGVLTKDDVAALAAYYGVEK